MPSNIQKLLKGKDEEVDYSSLIKKYPWIVQKNQKCILSPDSDGLLCGLFMSHYLGWQIKGFYDGKVMILEEGVSAKDCIFLDMEIFRSHIRSFGHHMVLYNKNDKPSLWNNFENCIQPNNMRDYDKIHNFRLKYPLATIHMLIGILSHQMKVELSDDAIAALFFTDGTFNVLFSYPENVLNWLKYLKVEESPLKNIFLSEKYSVYNLMLEMNKFFRHRDKINIPRERGDRLRISLKDGSPFNLEKDEKTYSLSESAVQRIKKFIGILSSFTGWNFKEENWLWNNFRLYKFTKSQFTSRQGAGFNNSTYMEVINKNPLSWAITSGTTIEYTLEEPDSID